MEFRTSVAILVLALFTSRTLAYRSEVPKTHPIHDVTVTCITNCSCSMNKDEVIIMADCSSRSWQELPEGLPLTLEKLSFANNSIKTVVNTSISQLKHLVELDLSYNAIANLISAEKQDVAGVKFSEHSLVAMESTGPRNHSQGVSRMSVNERKHGQTKNDDKQRRIPNPGILCNSSGYQQAHPFANLSQLKKLFLQSNQLTCLYDYIFQCNGNLKLLDLSSNAITSIPAKAFQGLSKLETLCLQNNTLLYDDGTFAKEAFVGLTSLVELNIKSNQPFNTTYKPTTTYPDGALSQLKSLQRLKMDGMPGQFVLGKGFNALSNLKLLDMSSSDESIDYCTMHTLPNDYFSNITTRQPLTVLLDDCHIGEIEPDTLGYLPTLTTLSLKGNHAIKIDGFLSLSASLPNTSIKHLNISNIEGHEFITDLNDKYFIHVAKTKLETLIMDTNSIIEINGNVPAYLHYTGLKHLSIGDNSIIRAKEFLTNLPMLNKMEIFNFSCQNKFKKVNGNSRSKPVMTTGNQNKHQLEPVSSDMNRTHDRNIAHVSSENVLSKADQGNQELSFLDQQPKRSADNVDTLSVEEFVRLQKTFCPSKNYSTPSFLVSQYQSQWVNISRPNKLENMYSVLRNGMSEDVWYKDMSMLQKYFEKYIFPQHLREIYASEIKLGLSWGEMTLLQNNIEIADASENFLWCWEGPIKGASHLKVLDLSENYCIALSRYFFYDLPELTTLYLAVNTLGPSLVIDIDGITFSRLKNLQHIDLAYNSIATLPYHLFWNNDLLKTLILSNNFLRTFNLGIGHMKNLEYLDLSNNALEELSSGAMSDINIITQTSSLTINLSNNDLQCNCKTFEFLSWFLHSNKMNKNITFHNIDQYKCTHQNGSIVDMKNIDKFMSSLQLACAGEAVFVTTMSLFLVVLVLWVAAGVAFYFRDLYRGKLYFYYYISNKRFFNNFANPEIYQVKDVFIVYDADDIGWRRFVIRILLPQLSRRGITCHVPELHGFGPGDEEATAGRSKRDVVEDSVLKGKKILVLLSRDLFDLEDHELEVTMAKVSEDLRGTRVLLFLQMEKDIPAVKIPRHIRYYLQSNQPLVYGGDTDQFWDHLVACISRCE